MGSKRFQLIYIYTNCFIYIIIIVGLFGKLIQRRVQEYSDFWKKNVNLLIAYDLITLAIIFILFVITIGLIKLKPWSRSLAIVWNISIAFILIGVPLIFYYVLIGIYGATPKDFNYFDSDTILWFVLGIILIYLSISFNKKSIKELFKQPKT
jgi:hypothetical protein